MIRLIEDPQNNKVAMANLALPNRVKKAIRRGAYISGKQLVSDLRADMTKAKSGRVYKVSKGVTGSLKKPRLHRASSRSETPAVISGEFRKSIDFAVRGSRTLEFGSGSQGLAKDYARVLELGSGNMAARKPLGRTVKKMGNKLKRNFSVEINKQMRSLGFKITRI